jgi:pimeloyl-ACP methyl ester carboxylesterase
MAIQRIGTLVVYVLPSRDQPHVSHAKEKPDDRTFLIATLITAAGAALVDGGMSQARPSTPASDATVSLSAAPSFSVRYQTVMIDGQEIFYREAGPKDAPVILLLHGFPTSSHMFRNLIPALADKYRVIAPDYPGFGNSSMPSPTEFEYSFDNLAKVVDKFTEAVGAKTFALYVQDYGAPIGFRIASAHPERITGLIIQNGNAYEEGLRDFWVPFKAYWKEPSARTRRADAAAGVDRDQVAVDARRQGPTTISPDTWTLDQAGMDRPGNKEIQLASS